MVDSRKNDIAAVVAFLFIIALVGYFWWYDWNDCRTVGHSWLYCIRHAWGK